MGFNASPIRARFADLPDTTVHLEWTTVPVENPMTFKFGALTETNSAPRCFINGARFVTKSLVVVNLPYTNAGPGARQYARSLPLMAVPASVSSGGPATNPAVIGSCLELEFVSLTGPPQTSLSFWESGQSQPSFSLAAGEAAGTNRVMVSQTQGTPASDPYGCVPGRYIALNQPGLYCLGFRVVDTSTGTSSDCVRSKRSFAAVRCFRQPRCQWSDRRQWWEVITASKQIPVLDGGGRNYAVAVQIITPAPQGADGRWTEPGRS